MRTGEGHNASSWRTIPILDGFYLNGRDTSSLAQEKLKGEARIQESDSKNNGKYGPWQSLGAVNDETREQHERNQAWYC